MKAHELSPGAREVLAVMAAYKGNVTRDVLAAQLSGPGRSVRRRAASLLAYLRAKGLAVERKGVHVLTAAGRRLALNGGDIVARGSDEADD